MVKGPFTAKELGFNIPGLSKLFIGGCGIDINDPHYMGENTVYKWRAHTHICPQDSGRGSICFSLESDVTEKTMMHEYAHLLEGGLEFECPHQQVEFFANFKELQSTGHTYRWKRIMIKLGQPISPYYRSDVEILTGVDEVQYEGSSLWG